jgi:hypothetical protein
VTTLHDVGGVLGRPLGHFLLGSHNFMVTALCLCVKWPLYQGHTKKGSGSGPPKYQPYVFGGNTGLGFMVARAAGGAGCRGGRLASSASSSSNHHKSQPCIPSEYVGLVFWRAGAATLFGVALVLVHTTYTLLESQI